MNPQGRSDAGSALLHPVPLLAIALLLVNDHLLKDHWGHPFTGHLSDVAGLLFFPLVLVSIVELVLRAGGAYRGPSNTVLVAATGATAAVFTLIQTTPLGGDAYRFGLGALQAPLATVSWALGRDDARIVPVALTQDPRDLLALPVLLLTLAVGSERSRAGDSIAAQRSPATTASASPRAAPGPGRTRRSRAPSAGRAATRSR